MKEREKSKMPENEDINKRATTKKLMEELYHSENPSFTNNENYHGDMIRAFKIGLSLGLRREEFSRKLYSKLMYEEMMNYPFSHLLKSISQEVRTTAAIYSLDCLSDKLIDNLINEIDKT